MSIHELIKEAQKFVGKKLSEVNPILSKIHEQGVMLLTRYTDKFYNDIMYCNALYVYVEPDQTVTGISYVPPYYD